MEGASAGVARDGGVALVADLQAAALAEQVGMDVVPVPGLARVDDGAERAAGKTEVEDGGVVVGGVAEVLRLCTEGIAKGGDALNLEAGDEAGDIEVMDGHVHELTAAADDVLAGWRVGIVADGAEEVDGADLAGGDASLGLGEAGVVAALEADLERHAGALDDREGPLGRLDVEGDGLLTEDGLAGAGGGLDEVGVGSRGGDDDDGVDTGIVDGLARVGDGAGVEGLGELAALGAGVGHGDEARLGQSSEGAGVGRAEAASAEECDAESCHPVGQCIGHGSGTHLADQRYVDDIVTQPITRRRLTGAAGSLLLLTACAPGQSAPDATQNTPTPPPAIPIPTSPPTPPPQPTATPVPWNPLTGQNVGDLSTVRRRIVAAKIDNAPLARPQFGLSAADLVYEQLAEGGLTRFLALYLQSSPDKVGPIRSARLTDIYLGQEWDFLLAYAGAGRTTARMLAEALVPAFKAPELGETLNGTPYARDNGRPIPHNMFARIAGVREAASGDPILGKEVEIRPFPFADAPETGPLRTLNMPYVPQAAVRWNYDTGTNTWKRTMAGTAHVDALNNQQIAVENVVLQYAQIFTAQGVEPDAAGNPVLDTLLRGENKVRVFHSGQTFEGVWVKEHDRAKTQYRQADGAPVPFRPGKVWIHVVPTDFNASWT